MKTRSSYVAAGFFSFLLAMLLLTNCSKDEAFVEPQNEALVSQNLDIPVIPGEIAVYMTEAEKAAFYASKPTTAPASAEVQEREGDERTWHAFFAYGDIKGNKYPILSQCDNPPMAEICPIPGNCPDVENYVGYAALWAGKATMEGFGQMKQYYSDFVCGIENGVETGWNVVAYKKGENDLEFRVHGTPYTLIYNEDGTVSVDWKISICSASKPNSLCWSYSTGVFKEMEGDGTVTCRWRGSPINFYAPLFEPFIPAKLLTWGWLYY